MWNYKYQVFVTQQQSQTCCISGAIPNHWQPELVNHLKIVVKINVRRSCVCDADQSSAKVLPIKHSTVPYPEHLIMVTILVHWVTCLPVWCPPVRRAAPGGEQPWAAAATAWPRKRSPRGNAVGRRGSSTSRDHVWTLRKCNRCDFNNIKMASIGRRYAPNNYISDNSE